MDYVQEEIRKEKAKLGKKREKLEKRHKNEKAFLEDEYRELQERCPHLGAPEGPGVGACPDCGLNEFYRDG